MGKIKFDFFNGTCTTNNEYVFLCFSNVNGRQCYKSVSALPTKWWTWFTYAPKTKFNHKAGTIAASSGNLEILIFYEKVFSYKESLTYTLRNFICRWWSYELKN